MAYHQERSKVWRYFTRSSDNTKAKCHLCLAFLSFKGGSISNLHLHLRRKHAEHLDEQSGTLIKYTLPDPLKDIERIEFFKNDENVKKLIELVRQRGNVFYKFSRDNLWNSQTQEKLWKEVAEALEYQVTYMECRRCWRSLRYYYDLYKKDPKSSYTKFVDQLKFLDSLYVKSKTLLTSSNNERKRKLSVESENMDEIIVENRVNDENFEESLIDESEDLSHLNHEIIEENVNLAQGKPKPSINLKNEAMDKSLSFYKNFDEMDDLDFFLGFLNKKMRNLSAEERSFVEMKLTHLIFEAEAGVLQ